MGVRVPSESSGALPDSSHPRQGGQVHHCQLRVSEIGHRDPLVTHVLKSFEEETETVNI